MRPTSRSQRPIASSRTFDDLERAVALADRIGDPCCGRTPDSTWCGRRYQQCDLVGRRLRCSTRWRASPSESACPYQRWQRRAARHRAAAARRTRRRRRGRQRARPANSVRPPAMPDAPGAFGGMLYDIRCQQGRLDEIADFFLDVARDNPSIAALRAAIPMHALRARTHRRGARTPRRGGRRRLRRIPYDVTWLNGMNNFLDAARRPPAIAAQRRTLRRPRRALRRRRSSRPRVRARPGSDRPAARARRHPARRLRPGRGMVRDRARHPRPTPSAVLRRRSANSTTPTCASPAAPTATSNAHVTSLRVLR